VTARLVQASDAGQRVKLRYGKADERAWEIEIDPWAVVVRHRRWYLLGWSHGKRARRVLRVDRVRTVEVLPQRFEAPAGLNALAAVEEQLSMGWKYDVEVLIHAPASECRHWLPRSFGRLEDAGDDRARLVATTDEPDWYAAQLANLPFPFRLVGSPEVREAMVVLGRRLLEATAPG
jgi:predicted DNA-binding transcriptional regulator YafY